MCIDLFKHIRKLLDHSEFIAKVKLMFDTAVLFRTHLIVVRHLQFI